MTRGLPLLTWSLHIVFSLIIVLETGHAQSAEGRETTEVIKLSVGEQMTLSATGVRSYSEGITGIVEVRLPKDKSQFILVALRAGTTSLLIIKENGEKTRYRIIVSEFSDSQVYVGPVAERKNIRLDFYFVQLSDSSTHQIGMRWPSSFGGQNTFQFGYDFARGGITGATASVTGQVLPQLDAAQAQGWAKILRQAVVVTANGSPAEFRSGGEVNFRVQGSLAAEIRSIKFGSIVGVTPRYDPESRRIDIQINAEVSDLSSSTSDVPGRSVTDLQTAVNLQLGQCLVLGGLVARSTNTTQSGLFGLSQIPILGLLFGTNQRQENQTENVVLIIPTVVESVPRHNQDQIQEALKNFEHFRGDLEPVDMLAPANPSQRRR